MDRPHAPAKRAADVVPKQDAVPEVMQWLERTYQTCKGTSVLKRSVYERYRRFCEENGLGWLQPSPFGKIVHRVFKTQTCRVGPRGHSATHYKDLCLIGGPAAEAQDDLPSPATAESYSCYSSGKVNSKKRKAAPRTIQRKSAGDSKAKGAKNKRRRKRWRSSDECDSEEGEEDAERIALPVPRSRRTPARKAAPCKFVFDDDLLEGTSDDRDDDTRDRERSSLEGEEAEIERERRAIESIKEELEDTALHWQSKSHAATTTATTTTTTTTTMTTRASKRLPQHIYDYPVATSYQEEHFSQCEVHAIKGGPDDASLTYSEQRYRQQLLEKAEARWQLEAQIIDIIRFMIPLADDGSWRWHEMPPTSSDSDSMRTRFFQMMDDFKLGYREVFPCFPVYHAALDDGNYSNWLLPAESERDASSSECWVLRFNMYLALSIGAVYRGYPRVAQELWDLARRSLANVFDRASFGLVPGFACMAFWCRFWAGNRHQTRAASAGKRASAEPTLAKRPLEGDAEANSAACYYLTLAVGMCHTLGIENNRLYPVLLHSLARMTPPTEQPLSLPVTGPESVIAAKLDRAAGSNPVQVFPHVPDSFLPGSAAVLVLDLCEKLLRVSTALEQSKETDGAAACFPPVPSQASSSLSVASSTSSSPSGLTSDEFGELSPPAPKGSSSFSDDDDDEQPAGRAHRNRRNSMQHAHRHPRTAQHRHADFVGVKATEVTVKQEKDVEASSGTDMILALDEAEIVDRLLQGGTVMDQIKVMRPMLTLHAHTVVTLAAQGVMMQAKWKAGDRDGARQMARDFVLTLEAVQEGLPCLLLALEHTLELALAFFARTGEKDLAERTIALLHPWEIELSFVRRLGRKFRRTASSCGGELCYRQPLAKRVRR